MPQVIAGAIVSVLGVTGTVATIATAALSLGISVGLSAALGKKGPKPSDGQRLVREAAGTRVRHYGMGLIGGQLTFHDSRGGTLGYIVTTGHGGLSELVETRLNGKAVTVGGAGVLSDSKFSGAIRVIHRLGTADQTAIGEFSTLFPEWTVNHRQRGCSHLALMAAPVKQKNFSKVYDGREPEITSVVKGVGVYDPRKDGSQPYGVGAHRLNAPLTWEWSDNAALIIADFVHHEDGFGRGPDGVNWANIAEEANLCDETLTSVDARTVKRWRLWGRVRLAEDERRDILSAMLQSCDGYSFDDGQGRFVLKVGRWMAPTVRLTDTHIIAMDMQQGVAGPDGVQEVKTLYTDAEADYGEQEAATFPRGAVDRVDVDRQQRYWCPDHNQAVRLSKLVHVRAGPDRWSGIIVTNLTGLNAIGERFIEMDSAELGAGLIQFSVINLQLDPISNRVTLQVEEARASDWAFDSATEEGQPPNNETPDDVVPVLEVPENVALSSVPMTLSTGATGVAVEATWDAPGRADLIAMAEIREDGGDWIAMAVIDDVQRARSGVVQSGVVHDVRVKFINITGRESAWSGTVSITPSAEGIAPSPPDSLSATGSAGQIIVGWRNPVQASFAYARIFRNGSNSLSGATQVGSDQVGGLAQTMSFTNSGLAAGTYYYWLRSYDASAVASAAAGPVSATAT